MFYYEENGKYYIECPYKGIYEIENNFEDMILSIPGGFTP